MNNYKADFYRSCFEALGDTDADFILSAGEIRRDVLEVLSRRKRWDS